MLMVKALAGTGKTTTALWGLGVKVPKGVIASDEQKAIIRVMRGYKWKTCSAQAYNTTIADKLKREVPPGVEAATSNAFGYRAWLAFIDRSKIEIDGRKNRMLCRDIIGHMPWKDREPIENAVNRLVSLCKCFLYEPTPELLEELASKFDIELTPEIVDISTQVFYKGVEMKEFFDFDDQNFMPLYHDIPIPKFDLVVVDEWQDLNRAKQEMAFRSANGPVVAIGDEHQAIYGFSGADAVSMGRGWERMVDISGDAIQLPLTMTRRNPKLVVQEANRWVPELRCHKNAPDGTVAHISEREFMAKLLKEENGYMILCRSNAPLTNAAFTFIKEGRRCYIQGKDIGTGLKREITKHNTLNLNTALKLAEESIRKRIEKESRSKFPDPSKVEGYNDKIMCLHVLCDRIDSIRDFENKVDMLFKDSGNPGDHQLSTVHKAKGLENPHVAILKPSKLPMIIPAKGKKKGTSAAQAVQERNLAYVADTRSQDTLIFMDEDKKDKYDISEIDMNELTDGMVPEEIDPEWDDELPWDEEKKMDISARILNAKWEGESDDPEDERRRKQEEWEDEQEEKMWEDVKEAEGLDDQMELKGKIKVPRKKAPTKKASVKKDISYGSKGLGKSLNVELPKKKAPVKKKSSRVYKK